MTTKYSTFDVSKEGLAKLLERRGGKAFAIGELIQNALDENTTRVIVCLVQTETRGHYWITVEDDNPTGFADLSHAYTLFAESAKKADPTKRGRFNLGEKFVIAICDDATIETTTGSVIFDRDGRTVTRAKREAGSLFAGHLRLTKAEVEQIEVYVRTLIPPAGITITYNGETLRSRTPVTTFQATLQTERADDDGYLRRTDRKTTVEVYEPLDGETPALYEMGLPVVETGDRWHVNVGQKVPLNSDRDNVPPNYLRAVRAETLNAMKDLVTEADSDATWITEAMTDKRVTPEALDSALTARFGERRVIFDPSDLEANKRAAAAGYTVIAPRSLPKGVSAVAREGGVLQAAGAVTPSPRPETAPDGTPPKPPDDWTADERRMAEFACVLAAKLLDISIGVQINEVPYAPFRASYGSRTLTFYSSCLGRRFYERGPVCEDAISLIIHELAHEYESDHLSDRYFRACTDLGARAVILALAEPELFRRYQVEVPA